MALHKNMTGSDVHESKGAETAVAGTVYVANGGGSGSWVDRYSGVYALNKYFFTLPMADISNPSSVFFHVPVKSEVTNLSVVLTAAITLANTIVSIYINGVLFADTLTVPFAGSTIGTLANLTVSTASTITANSVIEIRSDGGSSTVVPATIMLGLRAKP